MVQQDSLPPQTKKLQLDGSTEVNQASSTSNSNIKTDHRTSFSWRTAIFHSLARPIRPRLVKGPGKPFPPGSPQLMIDSVARRKCDVREYQVGDVCLYELRPKNSRTNETGTSHEAPLHELYYFAGGGFTSPPTPEHWRFFTKLSERLPQYRLVIVSYPLAPASPAPKSIPILQKLITALLDEARSQDRSVTLAGDSAGANLALVLGLSAVTSKKAGYEKLRNIMAICPVVDLSNNNPDISSIDLHDPLLTAHFTDEVARRWADIWPRDHIMLSPVFADLQPLAQSKVQVHGVIAGRDVLGPDTIIFKRKCEDVGISGEWLQWEKAMHCFPLAGAYGKIFPESWEGLNWIIKVLEKHC